MCLINNITYLAPTPLSPMLCQISLNKMIRQFKLCSSVCCVRSLFKYTMLRLIFQFASTLNIFLASASIQCINNNPELQFPKFSLCTECPCEQLQFSHTAAKAENKGTKEKETNKAIPNEAAWKRGDNSPTPTPSQKQSASCSFSKPG